MKEVEDGQGQPRLKEPGQFHSPLSPNRHYRHYRHYHHCSPSFAQSHKIPFYSPFLPVSHPPLHPPPQCPTAATSSIMMEENS